MRVDALPVAGEHGQFLTHRLLLVEAGLAHVEQRRPDQHVGDVLDAQDERHRAVAVQRPADEARRARVLVEQDVVPRDQHVVEDEKRVDLVEAVGERVVPLGLDPGEPGPADVLETGRVHGADETERVLGVLLVAPVRDRRLDERLVGVRRGGLVLGPAHDDAGVGLPDRVQQHVGVLIARVLGAVTLGVGVGGDVERIVLDHEVDVPADVLGKARVDLVQHVLAVVERPHLARGLVAHPGDHAADLVHDRIDRGVLVEPVLAGAGRLQADRAAFAAVGRRTT